jgi:hypothetical protein
MVLMALHLSHSLSKRVERGKIGVLWEGRGVWLFRILSRLCLY